MSTYEKIFNVLEEASKEFTIKHIRTLVDTALENVSEKKHKTIRYMVVLDEDYSTLGHDEYLQAFNTEEEADKFIGEMAMETVNREIPNASKTLREAVAKEISDRYYIERVAQG